MENNKPDSVKNWLQNLAQESWQLELLVSAFTIFLLIAGQKEYYTFFDRIPLDYDLGAPLFALAYIFLSMVGLSFQVLIISLITHLLLRGFWIGTIGLRSVQDHVNWEDMNYSNYITDKLKKKVRNLDDLVIFLDEICSVIFSFSFLLISIILAFGLTILVGGILGAIIQSSTNYLKGIWSDIFSFIGTLIIFIYVISALIYMIDFFTLGFFKKYKTISKIYYPIYKVFGFITVSSVSRSIYYHLISRFSKKKIRIVYLLVLLFFLLGSAINIDHNYYFSSGDQAYYSNVNYYDEYRTSEDQLVVSVSVPSKQLRDNYLPLFIRYDPNDNSKLEKLCSEFNIEKPSLFKWNVSFSNQGNIEVSTINDFDSNSANKLACLISFYQVILNDSILSNSNFVFERHPITNQKGISIMINSSLFKPGKNKLEIEKLVGLGEGNTFSPFAQLHIWK